MKNIIIFNMLFFALLFGCSSEGQKAPRDLRYAKMNAIYTIDGAIEDNVPSVRGSISQWTISPALSRDLYFNSKTGIISGTPRMGQEETAYLITASNSAGSASVTITIAVNDLSPGELSYSEPSAVYIAGKPIENKVPAITGSGFTFTSDPSLPGGLILDPASGTIYGVPANVQDATNYTITATNSRGFSAATISIAIILEGQNPPSGLYYSQPSAVYTINGSIIANTPTVSGNVISFSVSPELPVGLNLDSVTGIISGTPVSLQSALTYTITATNFYGTTSCDISITVNDSPPSSLKYSAVTAYYTLNAAITENVPTVNGSGLIFSVNPALPSGLSLNTVNGKISGTPTVSQDTVYYTITAANSGGTTTAVLLIRINSDPPGNLSYSMPNGVYTKGGSIPDNVPTVNGSGISYSVAPSLPGGLSLNASSGIITGAPADEQPVLSYLITATNSGGSTSVVITIKVNNDPPSGLLYSSPVVTYEKGKTIENNVPTVTGSGLTFSVIPVLPNGLLLDSSTGIISGTPAGFQGTVDFKITAQNGSGTCDTTVNIKIISNVNLSNLVTSAGTWYPAFSPDVINYTLRLPLSAGSIDLTPTAQDPAQVLSLKINGADGTSDTPMDLTMNLGDNTITVQLTGEDSVTAKTYTIRAIRGFLQEAFIKAPNVNPYDYFGYSVALDGDTLAVGAYFESGSQNMISNGESAISDNSASGQGAVYVFKRTGTSWVQEAYLKASNGEIADNLGYSVAISGDTIVAGAILEDSNQTTVTNGGSASADNSKNASGAVYVFKRTGSTWTQEAYLKAANADANDNFGFSISIHNDTVVVGAPYEDSSQAVISNGSSASLDNSLVNSGAAYVFKRTGTTWVQEAYLKAGSPDLGDNYGHSVAVSGDTIVVGAIKEDSNQNTITNGTACSSNNSYSSAGAAYVYKRTVNTWEQEAFLKPSDPSEGRLFGRSVAMSGETIIVGSDYHNSFYSPFSGAAYIFVRSGTIWTQEAILLASNGENDDGFGYSVAISGDTVAIGAINESSNQQSNSYGTNASADNSQENAGAVYVFKRSGGVWSQNAYLKAPNAETYDFFGNSVSISGDTISVGAYPEASSQTFISGGITAPFDNVSLESGAVYIIRE